MVAGAKLAESWADFFGSLFWRFGSVLESLMLVCDFLLSSPTVGYVDSDFASLSFWKISGEKIERRLGRTHGHEKIGNFWKFEKIAEIWFWKLISLAFSNCGIEMIAVAIFKMLRTRKNSQETVFLEPGELQNLFGSCAARNIQDFGGATCLIRKDLYS